MTQTHVFLQDLKASRAPVAAFMTVGIFWGSFAALVPDIKAAIAASDGVFGAAMLVASFGAVAAMVLAPRVQAWLGPRALQGCAIFMAAAFLLPGLSAAPVFFAAAMVLASAGSGTLDVLMNLRVSEIEARTARSLMNLNHAMFSFAYAGAALLTGVFREAGASPSVVFSLMFVVAALLSAAMYCSPQATDAEAPGASRPVRRALVASGGTIILIAFLAEQSTESWSALHLERGLGGSAAQGALGPAILGLTMGVGRLSGQVIAQRVRETVALQYAGVVAAAGMVIASYAPSLAVAYAGFAILGLGVSIIAPMAYSAVGKRVAPAQRAVVITRISVIGYFGFFIGPPLMGGISELFGLSASFLAVAVVLLLVSAVLAPVLRRQ